MLLTNDIKFVHLILDIIGDVTDIIFKLAIIEDTQFFIDFIFETVQVNSFDFLFEVLFVGLEEFLFEVRGNLKFLEFGYSQFKFTFDCLGLFLVLDDLLFEGVDCLCVGFGVEVLQALDPVQVLQTLNVVF